MPDDDVQVRKDFHEVVNLTASELQEWLASEQSRSVGQDSGDGEAVGHASGRRIVDLLGTKVSDLDEDDHAHMRKVVGYVHRHLAQRPSGDIHDTPWRYSLMNWGHDPEKG